MRLKGFDACSRWRYLGSTSMAILMTLASAALCFAQLPAKPEYLESYREPETGCTVIRISGDPGTPIPKLAEKRTWSDEVRHHYSLDQAWNADQSLLALDRNRGCPNLLLDGRTCAVISEMPSFPYESRWHPLQPALRIYIGGNEVGYFDVKTGQKTMVAAFDNYKRLMFGPSKGNASDDGNMVAVTALRADGRWVVFAYNLATRTKYPDIELAHPSQDPVSTYEECTISPSGKYIVENCGDDVRRVYDLKGHRLFTTEKANPTHCDLGYDQAGNEVIVGRSNDKRYAGRLIMRRLSDGALTVLNGPHGEKLGCGHVSMRNIKRPGWAYCSGVFYPPYAGWVIAVRLDASGTVEKLARIENKWTGYAAEQHASPSPDGRKVIVASNWNASSGRPIQAFVIETSGQLQP